MKECLQHDLQSPNLLNLVWPGFVPLQGSYGSLWRNNADNLMAFDYKRAVRRVLVHDPDNSRCVRAKVKGYIVTQGDFTVFVHRKLRYTKDRKLAVASSGWNAVNPLSECFIAANANSRYEAALLAFKAIEKIGLSAYTEITLKRAAEMHGCEEINLEG